MRKRSPGTFREGQGDAQPSPQVEEREGSSGGARIRREPGGARREPTQGMCLPRLQSTEGLKRPTVRLQDKDSLMDGVGKGPSRDFWKLLLL